MAIQGFRTTGNFAVNERPENWRKGILLRYPNGMAPLLALTSEMKSESTNDPVFHWWEKELQTRRLVLTASLTAPAAGTAGTLTVTGGMGVKLGDILRVAHSGEVLYVTANPTVDTAVAVTRGFTASVIPAVVTVGSGDHNPHVYVIGSTYEEGSDAPVGVNFDPTEIYNHTQIFRNSLEMTRTAMHTNLRTEDSVKEAKREVSELHSVDIERAFWFGQYGAVTINGKPARLTRGIEGFIPAENIIDNAGVALKMTTLEGWLEQFFRFGSNEKMVFCGNRVLLGIGQAVRKNSSMNISPGIKEYGMNVTRVDGVGGTLVFKTHPLFNQYVSTPGATPGYYTHDSWMFVLDMKNIKYRYLEDSDTKYIKDQQGNGIDGMKSGFLTECGLEVHHAKTHFLVKGVATGAVDS